MASNFWKLPNTPLSNSLVGDHGDRASSFVLSVSGSQQEAFTLTQMVLTLFSQIAHVAPVYTSAFLVDSFDGILGILNAGRWVLFSSAMLIGALEVLFAFPLRASFRC